MQPAPRHPPLPSRRYLDLVLGCLLPALVQAAAEARLYAEHSEERRREGLPPEKGWQARLHGELVGLAEALHLAWPQAVVMLWVALGVAFDLSHLVAA